MILKKPIGDVASDGNPKAAARFALLHRVGMLVQSAECLLVFCCMLALLAASIVLGCGALTRHFFLYSSIWQDELTVFLLTGAIFLSASAVQRERGHIAINVIVERLPRIFGRVCRLFASLATVAFCGLFAWESWGLVAHAWTEGHTSNSVWAPPLWIPYALMALGMTVLCLRLLLQLVSAVVERRTRP